MAALERVTQCCREWVLDTPLWRWVDSVGGWKLSVTITASWVSACPRASDSVLSGVAACNCHRGAHSVPGALQICIMNSSMMPRRTFPRAGIPHRTGRQRRDVQVPGGVPEVHHIVLCASEGALSKGRICLMNSFMISRRPCPRAGIPHSMGRQRRSAWQRGGACPSLSATA